MEYNFLTNIESCHVDVPSLLYYSHIPTAVIALFFGVFILLKSKENHLAGKIFFTLSIVFSLWVLLEGAIWLLYNSINMMFLWSFLGLLYSLLNILSIYFVYVFIDKKDVSWKHKSIFVALLLPILLFTATKYNITGFDIENCQALEGQYFIIYRYFVGVVSLLWITRLVYIRHKTAKLELKKQILLLGLGVIAFLLLFSWSEIVASITENFNITQYGLFGMPVLLGLIAYLIVRFHTFNIKLIATQALVWGLGILIGSQFFFIEGTTSFVLNSFTFIGIAFFGHLLIKSVRNEIEQKEQLQKISEQLFNANEKLKSLDKMKTEFLSLASHQLRSPLTAIKGYTSMLMAGDFGAINDKQKETIGRVFESTNHLTKVVEDLLNVSKIEQGGMQYAMTPFDFEKAAKDLATDLSVTAETKGLKLTFETDGKAPYTVNGDMEKIRQVILNLLDNSMKYTKEGAIVVKLSKDEAKKKILWSVSDTGMGITPEILSTLFQKFSRGEGAKMNTTGSGLGLYLAKTIIEGHKGRVWAESAGPGKGSTFSLELDAV